MNAFFGIFTTIGIGATIYFIFKLIDYCASVFEERYASLHKKYENVAKAALAWREDGLNSKEELKNAVDLLYPSRQALRNTISVQNAKVG